MDRENISTILLQSRDIEPVRPKSLVPNDRFAWSCSIGDLVQPDWAKGIGAQQIDDVSQAVDRIVETCSSNGCVGLKVPISYYRPLGIQKVPKAQADRDLKALLTHEASAYCEHPQPNPIYDDPDLARALLSDQDFRLKHMYVRAGAGFDIGLVDCGGHHLADGIVGEPGYITKKLSMVEGIGPEHLGKKRTIERGKLKSHTPLC